MNAPNGLKTVSDTPMQPLIRPFQEFAERESSGGLVLLFCSAMGLLWVNSPWSESYGSFWHTNLAFSFAGNALSHDLHFWVNEGLMALFFLVVGLEIKRELLVGELATVRKAALPIAGAIGGVLAPALIYVSFNLGKRGAAGWGIPMATDIAFVIGLMALLGDRVPMALKVFLTALAIVDDIAAVLVIAVFYTADIAWAGIAVAGISVLLLIIANRIGVRHPLPFAVLGFALWLAILHSGVHATIAGVVLAMTIPTRTELNAGEFLRQIQTIILYFERCASSTKSPLTDEDQQVAIEALEDACEKAQPPLYRFDKTLHPWVTFLIVPAFALANAGVSLSGDIRSQISEPIALGVGLGLLIGKPLGIMLAAWLAVKIGWAGLPEGVTWNDIHGASWLAGMGFTMSLFIGALAFSDQEMLDQAKFGILAGSLLAGIVGSGILLAKGKPLSPLIAKG